MSDHNGNGNGNSSNGDGHGGSTAGKLRRLIAVYQRLANERNPTCPNCAARTNLDALQTASLLLNSAATNKREQRGASVLDAAVAIERARNSARRPQKPIKAAKRAKHNKAGGGYKVALLARRQLSADLLNHFDATEPRPMPKGHKAGGGIGPLVRRGYLKRKSDGQYVRTSKPYDVRAGALANADA